MDNKRRKFVMSAASAAATGGTGLWSSETFAQPAPAVRNRLSVGTMPANGRALESYRRGIAAMKALPASDPRNWTRMARVHLDFCPHNNWYILPWHRAYLTSFERVIRTLSGDNDFRVPYWDWTTHRQIPATFTATTHSGAPNALFEPSRTAGPGASMSDAAVGAPVISTALLETNFERFAGARPPGQNNTQATWQRRNSVPGPLESNPHNYVHGFVGGIMATFMSPSDPIFWCHHANLDRLWWRWVRPGFANSTSNLWLDFRFSGQFVNGDGSPWNPRVRDVLDVRTLGFTYGPIVPFPFPGPLPPTDAIAPAASTTRMAGLPRIAKEPEFRAADVGADTVAKVGEVLSVTLPAQQSPAQIAARVLRAPVPNRAGESVAATAGATTPAAVSRGRVIANVEAEIPPGPTPHVRVFLSCPYLNPGVPATDPHFVGGFAFFAPSHDDAGGGAVGVGGHAGHGGQDATQSPRTIRVSLDLTATLAALQSQSRTPDKLELQLLPLPVQQGEEPPAVRLRKVEFATT